MVPPKTHSARNAVSAADEAHRGTQWLLLKGHLPTFDSRPGLRLLREQSGLSFLPFFLSKIIISLQRGPEKKITIFYRQLDFVSPSPAKSQIDI